MSILDRILRHRPESTSGARGLATAGKPSTEPLTDDQAVERYRYLLRTAPPEAIEQVHEEALAQLTPTQRRLVLDGLNGELPPQERANGDDPRSLARLATRTELRRPGTLERTFGGINPRGSTAGTGGLLGGNFLNTIAAVVVGSAIAEAIFADSGYVDGFQDGADAAGADQGAAEADASYDSVGAGYDTAGDLSVGDISSGDFGGGEF